jgi:hypothetical protein
MVKNKLVSITEAAKINNVTRQAIYVAIKLKKLRANKDSRWNICTDDLHDYNKSKYSREDKFDNESGFYSINQIAKLLKVPTQKIYYAARCGYIKTHRNGAAYVVQIAEAKAYCERHLRRKWREAM